MYFDGAVNNRGAGICVILISPEGETIPMAKRLEFEVTNNQAKYEACIFGFEALQSAGVGEITVYGDSMLVVKQISNEWEVREDRLRLYWIIRPLFYCLLLRADSCIYRERKIR